MAADSKRTRLPPEKRRALIIDAATAQITERGYNSFTLSRLADDCGMTRAGIEHHFPSRDDLLTAVLRHRDDLDLAAANWRAPTPAIDSAAAAWEVLDDLVARNAQQPEIVRMYTILSAEALDPQHAAHAYFRDRNRRALELLERIAAPWHSSPGLFAVTVLAVLDGIQIQWLRDPQRDLPTLWRDAGKAMARTHLDEGGPS